MSVLNIVNIALGKLGGAGDQLNGNAFLENLTGTDKVTAWVNAKYPVIRQKVIADFATMNCPFAETLKLADLGDDIKQNDVGISSIAVGAGPGYEVTVTTAEAHGKSTGDTVFLADIKGTGVTALNGTTKTITVIDDTSFTLNDTEGTAVWDHTADCGIVSDCPEIGVWQYAFNLPSDYYCMVRHCDEINIKSEYKYRTILNKDGDGLLLLTDTLTNAGGDSAYIEYCVDQEDTDRWSSSLVESVATLLAAELCPVIGRDLKTRQEMLVEYKRMVVPESKRFNQGQQKSQSKSGTDYTGGRGGGSYPAVNNGLGTYVDGQGNRRNV